MLLVPLEYTQKEILNEFDLISGITTVDNNKSNKNNIIRPVNNSNSILKDSTGGGAEVTTLLVRMESTIAVISTWPMLFDDPFFGDYIIGMKAVGYRRAPFIAHHLLFLLKLLNKLEWKSATIPT